MTEAVTKIRTDFLGATFRQSIGSIIADMVAELRKLVERAE